MRRVVVLALLALALPMGAWADIILTNQFGTISVSNAVTVSKGSQLNSFNGFTMPGHNLRSDSFTTRAMNSGTLAGGGGFWSVGSPNYVIGKGNRPHGANTASL